MKVYKYLILLIPIFLTGCSFEYNINIDDDTIFEENNVYITTSTRTTIEEDVESLVRDYTGPTDSLGMYNKEIINKDNIYGMSYKKDYSVSDYNYSISFSSCYDSSKIIKEGRKITIATGQKFTCFDEYKELEDVTVTLTADNYNVISNNADRVIKDKYIWYINKNNQNNKVISIVLEAQEEGTNLGNNKGLNAFTIVVGAFVLGIIIFLLMKFRSKKKNKI